MVATKCDADGMAANLAKRMERAFRKWLENWRGAQMTAARVENGVNLTSCVATIAPREKRDTAVGTRKDPQESKWARHWRENMSDDSPPSLLDRIMCSSNGDLRGAAMVLPRSWDIALEVLEALGSGRQVPRLRLVVFGFRVKICSRDYNSVSSRRNRISPGFPPTFAGIPWNRSA